MAAKTAQKAPAGAAKTAAEPKSEPKSAKAPAAAKAGKAASAEPKAPRGAGALNKPLTPSKDLAAIVGSGQVSRPEVVKKVWEHIKAHNLQDPKNKRDILADAALKKVFGKDKVSMFEMNKILSGHLS